VRAACHRSVFHCSIKDWRAMVPKRMSGMTLIELLVRNDDRRPSSSVLECRSFRYVTTIQSHSRVEINNLLGDLQFARSDSPEGMVRLVTVFAARPTVDTCTKHPVGARVGSCFSDPHRQLQNIGQQTRVAVCRNSLPLGGDTLKFDNTHQCDRPFKPRGL